MNPNLYLDYAELELQLKKIEEQRKILRMEILAEMQQNHTQKLESNVGTFSIVSKKTFVFNDVAKSALLEQKEKRK